MTIDGQELMHVLAKEPVGGFIVMQHITELINGRLRNSREALLRTYEKQRGYEESVGEKPAYKLMV